MSNEFIENLRKSAKITDEKEQNNDNKNTEKKLSYEEEYEKIIRDKFPWINDGGNNKVTEDIIQEKIARHKLRQLFKGNEYDEEEER